MSHLATLSAALLAILFPLLATAGESTGTSSAASGPVAAAPFADRLTGDWGGFRSTLAEHGLNFDLWVTETAMGMLQGTGDHSFRFGGRTDALITLDTGKLGLWEGGATNTHLEIHYGDAPAFYGGGILAPNLALGVPLGGPNEVVASSLYFSQKLSDNASFMIGKMNVIDFLAADPFYGGWGSFRFMNLAFVAPVSGVLPPTIMGGVVNYTIKPITLTLMIYDPSDQTNEYWVDHLFSNGANFNLAAKWTGELAGRATSFVVNGVYSTRDKLNLADSLLPPDLQERTKGGTWFVAAQFSHLLIESPEVPGKGLGIYGKAGFSDGDVNIFQTFFTGGIAVHAMIPCRPDDTFGLGYFYYNFSDALQNAVQPVVRVDDEQGVELYYDLALTRWLRVTADLQWIDPATGANQDVWLAGLRASIRF